MAVSDALIEITLTKSHADKLVLAIPENPEFDGQLPGGSHQKIDLKFKQLRGEFAAALGGREGAFEGTTTSYSEYSDVVENFYDKNDFDQYHSEHVVEMSFQDGEETGMTDQLTGFHERQWDIETSGSASGYNGINGSFSGTYESTNIGTLRTEDTLDGNSLTVHAEGDSKVDQNGKVVSSPGQ